MTVSSLQAIREFILMKDGEFIVAQIKQNVLRKENMRKNSRRPIGFQSISLIKYKKDYQLQLRHQAQTTVYSSGFITPEMLQQCREMPSVNPDYGVVKTMPYIFYSSVFAFDNVLKILNIHQP
jgi:abnormal spindle-like microcephaly-associated protein